MGFERIVELLLARCDILGGLGHLHGGSAVRTLATEAGEAGETAEAAESRPLHPHGITLLVEFDDRVAVLVVLGEHPSSELAVPNEVVTTHLDTVLTAEVRDGVSLLEIPYTGLRMDLTRLHTVFGGDAVELLEDDGCLEGVCYVTLGNGDTDLEIVLVSVLETGVLGTACTHQCYGCDEGDDRKLLHR